MVDSASETGLSNTASGSDHAGAATDVDAVGPDDAASSAREGQQKTVDVPKGRKSTASLLDTTLFFVYMTFAPSSTGAA